MSQRKFSFPKFTDAQLEALAAKYPKAVQTVRKPVYRVLAMLAECGAELPEGIVLTEEKPAFLKDKKESA